MLGRPVVNKHRAFTFHRPSALWIAQIMVDMAFAAAQIMMFSLIVYFMCGLAREAAAFFTFYILIIIGYLAMTVRALLSFLGFIRVISPPFHLLFPFFLLFFSLSCVISMLIISSCFSGPSGVSAPILIMQ